MSGLVHNVRDVARMTDAEARRNGKKSDALDNCGTLMQGCFRTALQATGADISYVVKEGQQLQYVPSAMSWALGNTRAVFKAQQDRG